MIVNAGAGDDMYAVLLARSSTVGGFGGPTNVALSRRPAGHVPRLQACSQAFG